ncbi:sugar ABC transporter permease [Cohnella xylanilytica]|uniref:Sugar ABC transporter permease n=1 Tax=Cohnella xylanilytica TaxID=557555 RepID=A0A841TS22_9BACL|nr:ABC transporter permease subunit [Cohnella xylanilytica]MBB6690509.1 sugar ABC transporter permease [Cohnella xylanilytica]
MSSIAKRNAAGKGALFKRMWDAKILYLILLPGLIHMIVFKLLPLFGLVIAFQDYSIFQGVLKSKWVGFEHFSAFVNDSYFWKLVRNTVLLAIFNLMFVFPIPIIFALFVNEVKNSPIKRFVQTLSFFPYFISSAVMVSILYKLLSPQGGLVNDVLNALGFDSVFFMAEPGWFRALYVGLNVWQLFGYNAIIYIAAMTSIDPHLYEAADLDGASRWQKIFRVTLPSIQTTIVVMFILAIGQILTVDLDKILLMYNPSIYDTADVIQSYVYRQAFSSEGFPNYSYGAAVGLMQSVIAFVLVIGANKISSRYSDSRLF